MTELHGADYKPHIIIDGLDPDVAEDLRNLEAAIYTDPSGLQHAVSLLDSQEDTELGSHTRTIRLAVSKEAAPDFDEATEESIMHSAAMQELQRKRKNNQTNEQMAQQLAAEVRRTRLALFIGRVIDHGSVPATVNVLPTPHRAPESETATGLSA